MSPYQTINFADVDSFEPMPGNEWYGVEIDKVEVRENKNGDALYLNWELIVVDGDYENRRLWMMTSLKETALFRLKQVFEELGVLEDNEMEIEYDDDVEPTSKSGPRLLYPEVEGMEASVYIKNEMYEGREQNRVTEIRSEKPKSKKRSRSTVDDSNGKTRSRSRRDVEDDDETETRSRRASRSRRDEDDDDEPAPRQRTARSRSAGRRRVR